jgi:hypothetical protein
MQMAIMLSNNVLSTDISTLKNVNVQNVVDVRSNTIILKTKPFL